MGLYTKPIEEPDSLNKGLSVSVFAISASVFSEFMSNDSSLILPIYDAIYSSSQSSLVNVVIGKI